MSPSLGGWLRESFGVKTYADLAALSHEAVEALAKKERRRFAGGQIRSILAQARRRVRARAVKPPQQEASMVEPSRTEPTPRASDPEWQEFASFFVYFERKLRNGVEERRTVVKQRTAVHHMETGEQSQWPGIAAQDACEWMLNRIPKQPELVPSKETATTVTSTAGATENVVFVDIDRVQLHQPPRGSEAQVLLREGQVFASYVAANAPLSLEASFSFKNNAVRSASTGPMVCDVAFTARNLSTAVITQLGTTSAQVAESGTGGTAQMTLSGLHAGEYSLRVVVTPRDGYSGGGSGEVPFLRLV